MFPASVDHLGQMLRVLTNLGDALGVLDLSLKDGCLKVG